MRNPTSGLLQGAFQTRGYCSFTLPGRPASLAPGSATLTLLCTPGSSTLELAARGSVPRSGHSPMHASDELLQLPHAGPGFKVLHAWLPICSNVDVELGLVSLGVHQARLAGQDEWAQPDGVDLGGPGRGALVLFLRQVPGSWRAHATPTQEPLSLAVHSFAPNPRG